MIHHVYACDLEPCATAVLRAWLPPERVAGWLVSAWRTIDRELAARNVTPTGPAFARFTPDRGLVEVEAGYPIAAPLASGGVLVPSGLPGGPAAITVHRAPGVPVEAAYQRIGQWLADHGFTARDRHWEHYHTTGPESGDLIELVVPYSWARWVPRPQVEPAPEGFVLSS